MLFLIGEILMVFGILYFCVIMLASRNPNNHQWWLKPVMTEGVHLFLILTSPIVGLSLMIKGAMNFVSLSEIGLQAMGFVAFLAVCIFVIKKLNIKQRLTEYDALRAATADLIPLPTSKIDSNATPSPAQKAA